MWIKHKINFIQQARHTWMEMYNNLFFPSQRGRILTSHGTSVLPTMLNWFLEDYEKTRETLKHSSQTWQHCVKCTALLHSVKSGDFYTPRCDRYKNEETLNSSFFKNEESNNRWWEISLSHPQGLDLDYYSKSRFYRGVIIPIGTTVAKNKIWIEWLVNFILSNGLIF